MAKAPYTVIDLKALRCLWAIARRGSIKQAGIELGITEVAVSQRVRALEKYLGVKLYEARGGKLRFTPAGDDAVAMAHRLFDQLEEFEDSLRGSESSGTITLGASDGVLRYLMPAVTTTFAGSFPQVLLRLWARSATESIRLVRTNEVDLGVVARHRATADLVFLPIATYGARLIFPPDHPLVRAGKPSLEGLLTPSILERYPLVMLAEDAALNPVRDVLASRGLPLNVALEAGTIETLKLYVSQGRGIGALSTLCLPADDHGFVEVDVPEDIWPGTTYGVILRSDKYRTAPLSRLIELLTERGEKS